MTPVPGFECGDKVWPKTGSTMTLQRAPQTVLASHCDPALGDWLWLDGGDGFFRSWHAVNWTTEEPDDAEKAARVERGRRVGEECKRIAAEHRRQGERVTAETAVPLTSTECPECGESVPVSVGSGDYTPAELAGLAREYAADAHPGHLPVWVGETVAECMGRYFSLVDERITALEAARLPQIEWAPEWTPEQVAEFKAKWDELLSKPGVHLLPPAPVLTPETAKALAREYVTIVKPGEVLAVRLPLDFSSGDVDNAREFARQIERETGVKVTFIPGEEFGVARPEPDSDTDGRTAP